MGLTTRKIGRHVMKNEGFLGLQKKIGHNFPPFIFEKICHPYRPAVLGGRLDMPSHVIMSSHVIGNRTARLSVTLPPEQGYYRLLPQSWVCGAPELTNWCWLPGTWPGGGVSLVPHMAKLLKSMWGHYFPFLRT